MTEINVPSSPMRNQYTTKKKIRIAEKAIKSNMPYEQYAAKRSLNARMLRRWIKNLSVLKQKSSKSIRTGSGQKPHHPVIEAALYEEIVALRERGIAVGYEFVRTNAIELFKKDTQNANSKIPTFSNTWIKSFLTRYDLTLRKRSSSRVAKERDEEIINNFKNEIKQVIRENMISLNDVYNMDETAVFLDMAAETTIDFKGAKRVSIGSHQGSKKRFTVALTITATGQALRPLIIFKGNKTKLIEVSKTKRHDTFTQSNAWMTQEIMKHYVQLLPTKKCKQLLIMDSFSAHKNIEILKLLDEKNFIVKFIPSGFTDLLQPLDLSIMKPFKNNLRKYYANLTQSCQPDENIEKLLTKSLLCEWSEAALKKIDKTVMINAFKHFTTDL